MSPAADALPRHDWQFVAQETWRLRVPGGWLYQVRDDKAPGIAVAFVPNTLDVETRG